MNKREARRIAYQIAYRFVAQALDAGDGREAGTGDDARTLADQQKIEDALDDIAQRLYERGSRAR